MTLLAVERIKLFTTRSPWWCALIALVFSVGFAALLVGVTSDTGSIDVLSTQAGHSFAMAVVMVLAALAATTEYRFNTIRTTFQAIPHRGAAVVAKAVMVALVAFVIGEVGAFGAFGVAKLLKPAAGLTLNTGADWVSVAGIGVVYAFAAVIAVSVGILIRHSAGAISLILIYTLAVEGLIRLLPTIGTEIYRWLPFNVSEKFLGVAGGSKGASLSDSPLSPGWALAYFAGFSLVMLAIAVTVTKKRDA